MKDISEDQEWIEQCRRQMKRPLSERIRFGFLGTYETQKNRSFETMHVYREFMAKERATWEGYGKAA